MNTPQRGGGPDPATRGSVLVAADAEALATLAAGTLAAALRAAAARTPGDRAHDGPGPAGRPVHPLNPPDLLVALAGGTTPRAAYRLLARDASVPWARLVVLPGDERAVRPDHPDANLRLFRSTLVVPGALPQARLLAPIPPDAPLDAEGLVSAVAMQAAARRLEDALEDAGAERPLDLLLVGIGEDGHVASLFPGSALLAGRASVAVVEDAPKPPHRRLTLGPGPLLGARRAFVLASGPGKAAAVAAALEGAGPVAECPARLLRHATWLLDRAAAAGLHGPVHTAS